MTDYAIYDVFTGTALAGNPLAVVFDADRRTRDAGDRPRVQPVGDGVRQKPENPAHTARLRIFTPSRELPFAGHPTVGAAVALAHRRLGTRARQRDRSGQDAGRADRAGALRGADRPGQPGFAEFDLPRLSRNSMRRSRLRISAPRSGSIRTRSGSRTTSCRCGAPAFLSCWCPVHDQAAAARPSAMRQWERWRRWPTGNWPRPMSIAVAGPSPGSFHARMFAPGEGIGEDPATGAAAAALSGAIHL
jgi:trans-2,3-dihydro-3-hydroxyanthranilate isomerase